MIPAVAFAQARQTEVRPAQKRAAPARKTLDGVDVFVHWRGADAEELAQRMGALAGEDFTLTLITSRGVKVWPEGLPETSVTDHWRCRYMARGACAHANIAQLLSRMAAAGVDFIKTEHLCAFDGAPGYSLGQGQ